MPAILKKLHRKIKIQTVKLSEILEILQITAEQSSTFPHALQPSSSFLEETRSALFTSIGLIFRASIEVKSSDLREKTRLRLISAIRESAVLILE